MKTEDENLPKAPKRPRKRWKRYALLTLLCAGLVWYALPFLDSHAEQDRCEFGTGSTELYDKIRTEAEAYLDDNGWAKLAGYSAESARVFSDALLEQFREFAMTREGPTEKWIAVHALARAYKMEFASNGPTDSEKLASDTIQLRARYIILLPRYNGFCLVCYLFPESVFRLYIDNRGDGVFSKITGNIGIVSVNPKVTPLYIGR